MHVRYVCTKESISLKGDVMKNLTYERDAMRFDWLPVWHDEGSLFNNRRANATRPSWIAVRCSGNLATASGLWLAPEGTWRDVFLFAVRCGYQIQEGNTCLSVSTPIEAQQEHNDSNVQ